MRNPSRDRPSRKSPAIASRGAKPIEWTKPSNCGQALAQAANIASICASSATSQSKTSSESNSRANSADPLPEALALVAEGQLGAFAAAGAGDAVGDRAVRQHAGDEKALAGEKTHGALVRKRSDRFWHAHGACRASAGSLWPWSTARAGLLPSVARRPWADGLVGGLRQALTAQRLAAIRATGTIPVCRKTSSGGYEMGGFFRPIFFA